MKIWRWLTKRLFTAIFVCFLTMTTTIVTINAFTQHILSSLGLQLDGAKLTYTRVLSHIIGQGNNMKQAGEHQVINDDTEQKVADSEEVEQMTEQWDEGETIEAWGRSEEIIFSIEQFNNKKDQLSDEDKLRIFTIVIENIPPEEVQVLSTMMEDGITNEEMESIDAMLKRFLDEHDYEELLTIIDEL